MIESSIPSPIVRFVELRHKVIRKQPNRRITASEAFPTSKDHAQDAAGTDGLLNCCVICARGKLGDTNRRRKLDATCVMIGQMPRRSSNGLVRLYARPPGRAPLHHLPDFVGVPQADVFAGYTELNRGCTIQEAACMVHARRKIHDQSSFSIRACGTPSLQSPHPIVETDSTARPGCR